MKIFQRGLILVGAPLLMGLAVSGSLQVLRQSAEQDRINDAAGRSMAALGAQALNLGTELACLWMIILTQPDNKKLLALVSEDGAKFEKKSKELERICWQHPELIPRDQAEFLSQYLTSFDDFIGKLRAYSRNLEGHDLGSRLTDLRDSVYPRREASTAHTERGFWQSGLNLVEHLITIQTDINSMCERAQMQLDRSIHWQVVILTSALVLNPIMFVLLAIFYRRGILNRIRVIAQNTESIASGASSLARVGGNDEIAVFDESIQEMLRQLNLASENERNLFENASDVICVLDKDLKFIRINPACGKNWQYAPEALVGRGIESVFAASELDFVGKLIQSAREAQTQVTFEASVLSKTGSKRKTLWSIFWSEAEEKLFCIAHDITEHKRVESMRRKFLTLIGSDLKQPLTRISDSISLVLSDSASMSQTAFEKFDGMKKNLERLLRLVNDLLQIAELEFGSLELRCVATRIDDLLRRAAQEVEFLAQSKKLTLDVRITDCEMIADQDRITQVLVNLLSNAIKFSPEGKGIVLSARKENESVVFTVLDEGRGIPPSKQSEIFEKFKQVEVADAKRQVGTGLGLPICKQIVEAHGGMIGVDSQADAGSSFWFTLPIDGPPSTKATTVNKDSSEVQPAFARPVLEPVSDPAGQVSTFRLPLSVAGGILVGIPFLLSSIFMGGLTVSLFELTKERTQEIHQHQIFVKAFELMSQNHIMSKSIRFSQNSQSMLRNHENNYKRKLNELAALLKDDRESLDCLERMRIAFDRRLAIQPFAGQPVIERGVNNSTQFKAFMGFRRSLPLMIVQTRNLAGIIDRAEAVEFVSPEIELLIRQRESQVLFAGLTANILLSIALALQFSARFSKRLAIMADNCSRVAREETLNPPIGGNDELADLDKSFHRVAYLLAEARRKERVVFDNCKDVLCTISKDARFTTVNPAAEQMWGYTRSELGKLQLQDLVSKEDWQSTASALFNQAWQDADILHECRMVRKNGASVYCLWSVSKRQGEEGLFCVVYDVTDKKELEILRGEFLSIVSHDLRTPLTAISSLAQVACMGVLGKLSPDSLACTDAISLNCLFLTELISDILDLEKLDAGAMEFCKETTDLECFVAELTMRLPARSGVQIETSGEITALFKVDQERLAIAVHHLARFLQNRSAATLMVQVNYDDSRLEIFLLDSGPVIPESVAETLFERYKDNSMDNDLPAGDFIADLRLPLAARIIGAHGGKITIDSMDGKTNRCKISIPATKEV
ncbi:MAG: PAS domain S-box protein [Candidatus Melainabacteria bacterium]|nr:PAS domain S-box protein [Candidatus Melainabacteria bacterium]